MSVQRFREACFDSDRNAPGAIEQLAARLALSASAVLKIVKTSQGSGYCTLGEMMEIEFLSQGSLAVSSLQVESQVSYDLSAEAHTRANSPAMMLEKPNFNSSSEENCE
ncbi:hypothetical protein K3495_g2994 [Podosphaera aphanis]|nr:hypothetical protein K3495_g2994 [Podosphaera aphanis]